MQPVTLQSRDSFCLICCQLARKELNLRPASYKDAALTAELRASSNRVGGIRTHTSLIKSQVCSRYTTTQQPSPPSDSEEIRARAVATISTVACIRLLRKIADIVILVSVTSYSFSGSRGNRTQRSGHIRATWATSPRLPCGSC